MPNYGSLTTKKSWTRLLSDLSAVLRKWGKKDYVLPMFEDSRQSRSVAFRYSVQGKWVTIDSHRFRTPEQNLCAIVEALDAVRKAEQRGLGELLAAATQMLSLPPAGDTSAHALIGATASMGRDELTAKWRAAMKANHPDQGGDSVKFRQILAAGQALGLREVP